MPENPINFGWKSYSQCDEDGIIRECLQRISSNTPLSKSLVEIGCGNGKENNTHQLLLDGFIGYWVDGAQTNIREIEAALGGIAFSRLRVIEKMIDISSAHTVAQNAKLFLDVDSVDFFSLDIDGNDIHVCAPFIDKLNPKLVCVEYNAKFPPPTAIAITYNPNHTWKGDDHFGASLQAWVNYFQPLGYSLICCNLSGANAFFVRNDLLSSFAVYTVEELYQPPRYHLANTPIGHPASLSWLKQALEAPYPRLPQPPSTLSHHFAKHEILAKTSVGQMLVYAEDQIIGKSLIETGSFQEEKILEVTDFLKTAYDFNPKMFVDIGANIGTHSIYCLKNNICSQAILFEPDIDNHHLLSRNIGLNFLGTKAQIFRLALSNEEKDIEMELSNFNFGDHRIRPQKPVAVSFGEEQERKTQIISATTIDQFAKKYSLELTSSLVWMDTQGHEGYIFEGGRNFFSSRAAPKFVVTEFWPYGIERSGAKEKYFEFLRTCLSIHDINQEEWQHSSGISIESLAETYEIMLSNTEKEYHPHTDLLLIL